MAKSKKYPYLEEFYKLPGETQEIIIDLSFERLGAYMGLMAHNKRNGLNLTVDEIISRVVAETQKNERYKEEYEPFIELLMYNAADQIEEKIGQDTPELRISFGEPKKPRPSKRLAEETGAITTVGGYQTVISNKKYKNAFLTTPNEFAYISRVGKDFLDKLRFQNGQVKVETEEGYKDIEDAIRNSENDPLNNDLDLSLVREFFTILMKNAQPQFGFTYSVYLPTFCREMKIKFSSGDEEEITDGNNDFWSKLNEFKNYIGIINENAYVQFINIVGFDAKNQTLLIDLPYMYYLSKLIADDPDTQVKNKSGELLYQKSSYHEMLHADIVSERNKTAVEIANYIIIGLMQRGGVPDSKLRKNKDRHYSDKDKATITYSVSVETILEEVPLLKARIEETRGESVNSMNTSKNKKLQNAFKGAFKILKTKSDIYKYFVDLYIPEIKPTIKTLDTVIEVTHRGINSKYKKTK